MPELQLDGLPGPLLIHGGLAHGNLASQANAGAVTSPRAGARACLAKMRTVLDLGIPQAFVPPLVRPDTEFLRACGITDVTQAPDDLLTLASSTAYQWTANLGTCAPASDTRDGRDALVMANLAAMAHRSIEAAHRATQARRWLPLEIRGPLPPTAALGDEGAANHTRIVGRDGVCHVFVYGRDHAEPGTTRFAARQTLAASQAVARLLQLPDEICLFVRQNPLAIDAGAFHNDVVMVGNHDHLLLHEHAWVDQAAALAELQRRCGPLMIAEIRDADVPLAEAVRCYLFNSQLLRVADETVLVAPAQCADAVPQATIQRLISANFIQRSTLVNVSESMRGGGGPACLRLRIPLTDSGLAKVHPGIRLNHTKIHALEQWVDTHYRAQLRPADLRDPQLHREADTALHALHRLIDSGL